MRTIAIENGQAKLSKQQVRTLQTACDLLRGLRQIYFHDAPHRDRLIEAEYTIRDHMPEDTDGQTKETDE